MMNDKTSILEERLSKQNPSHIKYLIRIFRETFYLIKRTCVIFLVMIIANSVLLPLNAYLWGKYVDKLNENMSIDIMGNALLVLSFYFLINFVLKYLNRYLYGRNDIERLDIIQSHRYQEKINTRFLSKLNKISAEYFEIPMINDKIHRASDFVNDKWSGLNPTVIKNGYMILGQMISVILNGYILYQIEPLLCWIILITPVPIYFITTYSNKIKFKFKVDNSHLKRKADYFQDVLKGQTAKEVRSLHLSDFFFEKWKNNMDEYTIKEMRSLVITTSIEALSSVIGDLAIAGLNIYAVMLMITGRITVGQFSMVLVMSNILISGVGNLISSLSGFVSKKMESAEYYDIMDIEEAQSGERINGIDSIEIKDLAYRYPTTNRYVLKNINLRIKKGERIALVGANGAGKTTFAKILLKTLAPSKGTYLVNGVDAQEVTTGIFHDHLSVVFQNPARFNAFTVQDNIHMGDTSIPLSPEKIRSSLEFSGLTDVDPATYLGKELGGIDLSGGQWQKLAIAKAHYRDNDFIILDEPTSNIDPIFETEIYKKYLELAADKTVIYVTHRISTSTLADRIIVFRDGEIVEQGTYEELMANKEDYYQLFHTQSKWYDR